MSIPKTIAAARARVREVEAQIAAHDREVAELVAKRKPIADKVQREAAKAAKVPVLFKAAGDVKLSSLSAFGADRYTLPGGDRDGKPLREIVVRRAVEAGDTKVHHDGGQSFSPKSLPQRARRPSREALAKIARLERASERAALAYTKAQAALREALTEGFDAGEKVTAVEVAPYVARKAALLSTMPQDRSMFRRYERDRLVDIVLPDAKKHLAHAESRSKDPCPCDACRSARQNAAWKAQREAEAKARAKAEAAEARRRAKLPKVEFACPTATASQAMGYGYEDPHEAEPDDDGNVWVASPVETSGKGKARVKTVACPDCDTTFNLTTVLSRPVGGVAPGQLTIAA